ncbi:hypothetical protein GBAR_LOCUS134 [Geodia barretti]|jgi:hypothetical protein
MIW